MLTREFDLRIEAVNMRRFEDNFKNVKNVAVPKIYPDYCFANYNGIYPGNSDQRYKQHASAAK